MDVCQSTVGDNSLSLVIMECAAIGAGISVNIEVISNNPPPELTPAVCDLEIIPNKNFKEIRDEANYNQKVPSLIVTNHIGAIENYLSCRLYCSKEMVQSYENARGKTPTIFIIRVCIAVSF